MGDYEKVKFVLIDDNELFREGIKRILEGTDLFETLSVGNAFTAVIDVIEFKPDIILMDAELYYRSDVHMIHQVLQDDPKIKLVLFTDELANHQVLMALEHGVKGYFTKEMNVTALIKALQSIQRGNYWIHPHVSNDFANEYIYSIRQANHVGLNDSRFTSKPADIFTDREYQVLELLASGYNNQRISEKLKVTQSTVK